VLWNSCFYYTLLFIIDTNNFWNWLPGVLDALFGGVVGLLMGVGFLQKCTPAENPYTRVGQVSGGYGPGFPETEPVDRYCSDGTIHDRVSGPARISRVVKLPGNHHSFSQDPVDLP
jgi:hypothetical protein